MLGAAEVQSLLAANELGANRALGQNFVTDPLVIERIVDAAGVVAGSRVLEIGPGLGSLTLGLLEAGAEVLAVEKDAGLAEVLRGVLAARGEGTVELVRGDALDLGWPEVLGDGPWKMVSNLPYNVAVPIVLNLLAGAPMVEQMWVMVQLEVAERLCAVPGGRTIGVPTVKAGWYAHSEIVTRVAPEAFTPVPKVTSAVVHLQRRRAPREDVAPPAVFSLVEMAYRKRRKMLRSSLAPGVGPAAFEAASVAQTARPEELSVTDWANLAAAVAADRR